MKIRPIGKQTNFECVPFRADEPLWIRLVCRGVDNSGTTTSHHHPAGEPSTLQEAQQLANSVHGVKA